MLTPQEIAAKWRRNTSASGESYKQGVMAVQEAPTAKAAAAQDKYLAGVQDAVDSGKYRDGLMAVSLQAWQQAAVQTGAARLASGVAKGESKFSGFIAEFAPFQQQLTSRVRGMPSTTVEEREARMLAQVRGTRQFRRTRR